jgi:hypothetical protein
MDCRKLAEDGSSERAAHCHHVANLLDEIARRIEGDGQIDAVPASDLIFSWRDGITMSQTETLALRALCAVNSRPVFSILHGHPSTLPRLSAGHCADQAQEA